MRKLIILFILAAFPACLASCNAETSQPNRQSISIDDNGHAVLPQGTTTIEDEAFFECADLTEITIPDSVTTIGDIAFYGCSGLTDLTIPDSVTTIGNRAFYGCSALTSVTIPDSVSHIGYDAFMECTGLTSATLPSDFGTILYNLFADCPNLETISVSPDNATYDSRNGCNAVIRTSDNTLIIGAAGTIIPDNISKIEYRAFANRTNMESMFIPASITEIGCEAFSGCSGLRNLTVSEDNVCFDSRENCNAIIRTSDDTLLIGTPYTTIPSGVRAIAACAFHGCIGLTDITIPEGIIEIGDFAFYECTDLVRITLPSSLEKIGDYALDGCPNLAEIHVQKGSMAEQLLVKYGYADLLICE